MTSRKTSRKTTSPTVVRQEFDPAVPVDSLTEHPDNPRRGDDAAVSDSITHNGFYGAIVAQRSTGRILAGNTRFRAMVAAGASTVPVVWVDVDDERATRIMLADNRTSDLAYYDDAALSAILSALAATDDALFGTAYDQATYELLVQQSAGDGLGTARQGYSNEDREPLYEAANIRSVVLPYDADAFDRVVDQLAAYRRIHNLDTNAEAVARMLDEAIGDPT